MGTTSSINNTPAGVSVLGKTYRTNCNVVLACMGWSLYEDDVLDNIHVLPRDHTRPDHYCHNIGGFRILIKSGIKLQFIDFEKDAREFSGVFYNMKFMIVDDIDISRVIEYNDYIERGKVSSSNILLKWIDDNKFCSKGLMVWLSPFDFFNFNTENEPMSPKSILEEDNL